MRSAPSYESGFIQHYDIANSNRTLAGSFLQKSHRLLEQSLPKGEAWARVLEVGAGTGHHLPYVEQAFEQYVMTDANDAMLEIATRKYRDELSSSSLVIQKEDAKNLSYPDDSFDRVIASHILEHIPDPVSAMREWNRVVRPGGLISILLPCDPGLLWRFGRYFGPRRYAEGQGIAYDYMQAAEHVNSIFNLVVFIRHHFEYLTELWYPTRLPAPDLNLFYACHITASTREKTPHD